MLLALGILPSLLVAHYYGVIPHRIVIQWDAFGNTTVIGTRSRTVFLVANLATAMAVLGVVFTAWQNGALLKLGARRAFLGIYFAQIVAIDLTCISIVTDALGAGLKLKPTVPPAMAVALFAGGVLCWRLDRSQRNLFARAAAVAAAVFSLTLLGFSAIAVNAVVGYYASAFALLAMLALALPEKSA